jgi:hypothetical protein
MGQYLFSTRQAEKYYVYKCHNSELITSNLKSRPNKPKISNYLPLEETIPEGIPQTSTRLIRKLPVIVEVYHYAGR